MNSSSMGTDPIESANSFEAAGNDNTDSTPVDFSRLHEVTDGNEELLRDISNQYLEQADEILGEMEAAIGSEQFETVSQLAHKLAGSSAVCGMTAVIAPLRTIETLKPHQLKDARGIHQKIRSELSSIRDALIDRTR